jgi:hypothetical protein
VVRCVRCFLALRSNSPEGFSKSNFQEAEAMFQSQIKALEEALVSQKASLSILLVSRRAARIFADLVASVGERNRPAETLFARASPHTQRDSRLWHGTDTGPPGKPPKT